MTALALVASAVLIGWRGSGRQVRDALHRLGALRRGPTATGRGRAPRRLGLPLLAAASVMVLSWLVLGPAGALPGGVVAAVMAMGVGRLTVRVGRSRSGQRAGIPLVLDLLAVALRAGVPTSVALAVVAGSAPASYRSALLRTANLLDLGAEPAQAWESLRAEPDLEPVAAMAVRSAHSGIRLADGFERQAHELRAVTRTQGLARAHRVGTLALLPLGVCFLPAFVCLGVVPVIAGIASDAFAPIGP